MVEVGQSMIGYGSESILGEFDSCVKFFLFFGRVCFL
jgi:hypothetical protein